MSMDTVSARSGRLRSSTSDFSRSPTSDARMPHLMHQQTSSSLPSSSASMSIDSLIEASHYDTDYRTHSVPPSLHDHLSSQSTSAGFRGMRPEMLYGLSSSGESLYSSSDSCYSPLSDHLPGPQIPQNYNLVPDLVQRPHSATEICYRSVETSPVSVGPPTPVDVSRWSSYDHTALDYPTETNCLPLVSYSRSVRHLYSYANLELAASTVSSIAFAIVDRFKHGLNLRKYATTVGMGVDKVKPLIRQA